jgi:hypothetical protein
MLLFWQVFRSDHSLTSQEKPSVGVEDRSDYLRSGNVKLGDQSLGLADQETPQITFLLTLIRLAWDISTGSILLLSSHSFSQDIFFWPRPTPALKQFTYTLKSLFQLINSKAKRCTGIFESFLSFISKGLALS